MWTLIVRREGKNSEAQLLAQLVQRIPDVSLQLLQRSRLDSQHLTFDGVETINVQLLTSVDHLAHQRVSHLSKNQYSELKSSKHSCWRMCNNLELVEIADQFLTTNSWPNRFSLTQTLSDSDQPWPSIVIHAFGILNANDSDIPVKR